MHTYTYIEEQTRMKKPKYLYVMYIFLACSPILDWSSKYLHVKWVEV